MAQWGRKLKGLVGLSAVGGVIGAIYGAARAAILAFTGFGWAPDIFMGMITSHAGFAALTTAGVGITLATVGSRLSLSELSPWKAALVGGVCGAAIPLGVIALTFTGVGMPGVFLAIGARYGMLGAALGGGLVAVAQRADRRALPGEESRLYLED